MENYIQNIELINQYLNKTLSEIETQNFENRLKTDSSFETLYAEHITFLEGLKRQQLRAVIVKAKQSYIKNKWFRYLGISIAVLIVSVFVYMNLNNTNSKKTDVQPEEINKTKVVLDSVKPEDIFVKDIIKVDTLKTEKVVDKKQGVKNEITRQKEIVAVKIPKKSPQKVTVNSQKDTTIVCNEGTKLNVKANSFVNENNETFKGKVDLNIIEYYKLSDMLLANLSTQSDGKQLETGGMLFIEAKHGSERLNLKPSSTIEISFPSKNKKEDMQLFSGAWQNGNINWKPENTRVIYDEELSNDIEAIEIIERDDTEVPFAVIEQAPIYPGCENSSTEFSKKCTRSEISKFVQRNFNTDIAANLGLRGRQRVNVIFRINQNGNVDNMQFRSSHPDLEREANRVIALLPKMQPGRQRGKAVSVPYSLPIIFEVEGTREFSAKIGSVPRVSLLTQDSIINKRFEDRLTGKDSIDVSVSEVNGYVLRTSKLGWINCDRFINNSNRIKYKLKIKDSENVIVNMVFKSVNSLMPSWRINGVYDFRSLPKGEAIVLVAIKKQNGKLYFDVVETKTEENPNIEFNFKEVNLEELKNELQKLNKQF
tara:strand:+ start:16824 stop:18611 length:1788 start_codon:yes stop_codon:yes gene_type:complete